MKVIALKSFVSNMPNGHKYRAEVGDELDMPAGADWLEADLVELIAPETPKAKPVPVVATPRQRKRS